MSNMKWYNIPVNGVDLQLRGVLQVGQAFRWINNEKGDEFTCSLKISGYSEYGVAILKQIDNESLHFSYIHSEWRAEDVERYLCQYFRLEVELRKICLSDWKDLNLQDLNFGCRILKQDPWETLISFICSSNNNISRISKMCHNLAEQYGKQICEFNNVKYFSFPSSADLATNVTEEELRKLGFGYRAKYIIETAKKLHSERQQYLKNNKSIKLTDNIPDDDGKYTEMKQQTLLDTDDEYLTHITKNMDYEQLREYLMSFSGVGPKVADCVCLMGFQMDHIVPVDVHIGRIAKRDYSIIPNKTELKLLREQYQKFPVTKKKVNLELEFIRLKLLERWGPFAGWAQGIVFSKEIGSTSGKTVEGTIKKRKRKENDADMLDYIKQEVKIQ